MMKSRSCTAESSGFLFAASFFPRFCWSPRKHPHKCKIISMQASAHVKTLRLLVHKSLHSSWTNWTNLEWLVKNSHMVPSHHGQPIASCSPLRAIYCDGPICLCC